MTRITSTLFFKHGKKFFRQLSTSPPIKTDAQEIIIPTCYGHVAGKVWGPENGRKVLALHGWQDNCGTFDTLIPLLPNHLRIVAIDFPGHGLSSHKPIGCIYSFTDLLLDVKTVSAHLNWNRYSLMGHSMGGALSTIYACCFPEEIEAVVTLDGVDPDKVAPPKYGSQTARLVNKIAKMNRKLNNPAPKYTYEAAHARLLEGQKTFMTEIGVSHLIKRSIAPLKDDPNLYVFRRDIRLQSFDFQAVTAEIWTRYLESLQCSLLSIRAKDGLKVRDTKVAEYMREHFKDKKESAEVIEVEGLHHVHLENPERVASYVSKFFSE